jgi:hypothetical protein
LSGLLKVFRTLRKVKMVIDSFRQVTINRALPIGAFEGGVKKCVIDAQ